MFLLSDSLSARALEGLQFSVGTPQYQQNTIQSLTIYIHSFHFKFPNDEFDKKEEEKKRGGGIRFSGM